MVANFGRKAPPNPYRDDSSPVQAEPVAANTAPERTMSDTNTITLETPITRGEQTITEITLRKPKSGALRGTNLTDLLQMDVNALTKVLPRISDPVLIEADVANLDPADLTQLAMAVAGFLLPSGVLEKPDTAYPMQ